MELFVNAGKTRMKKEDFKHNFPYVEITKGERATIITFINGAEFGLDKGKKLTIVNATLSEGTEPVSMLTTFEGVEKSIRPYLYNAGSKTLNSTPIVEYLFKHEGLDMEDLPITLKATDMSEELCKLVGGGHIGIVLSRIEKELPENQDLPQEELPSSEGEIIEDPIAENLATEEEINNEFAETNDLPMSI